MIKPMVLVVKNPPASADIRDADLIPGFRRSPGKESRHSLPYSRLENLMDRGSWWATVYRFTKS